VGYRWYDQRGIAPAFAFGHGLSYTRFAYKRLRISRKQVSVVVSNVGKRTGVAVPQLYIGLPGARGRPQPPRQLKGFASVTLGPRDSGFVPFRLSARDFSFWNSRRDRWQVAPGCYGIYVGSSSRAIELRGRIALAGGRCPG